MKNRYFLFLSCAVFFSFSCRSVEKLVDKGRYDEAIDLAVDKLGRNKNLPTKHIRALEEGFQRIQVRDLKRIDYLKGELNDAVWDEVYDIIERIESRQKRLDLLMPIDNDEGYSAHFDFIGTESLKNEARRGAARFHYNVAKHLLDDFDSVRDRSLARAAFDELRIVHEYIPGFEDSEKLLSKAKDEGVVHVLLKWHPSSSDLIPRNLRDQLVVEAEENKDRFWIRYHDVFEDEGVYDILAQIVLEELLAGPDREEVNRSQESRVLLLEKEKTPQTDIDTIGVVDGLKPQKSEETLVHIVETIRTKTLDLKGFFEMRDYATGKLLERQPFVVSESFYSSTVEEFYYRGKHPQGSSIVYIKQGDTLLPFPSTEKMVRQALLKLKKRFDKFVLSIQTS